MTKKDVERLCQTHIPPELWRRKKDEFISKVSALAKAENEIQNLTDIFSYFTKALKVREEVDVWNIATFKNGR